MRIWRALKAIGCRALRDGAYLLRGGGGREQALRELADACTREGGSAWLMAVAPRAANEDAGYRALFASGREPPSPTLRRGQAEADRGPRGPGRRRRLALARRRPLLGRPCQRAREQRLAL